MKLKDGERAPHLTEGRAYAVVEISGSGSRIVDDGGAPSIVKRRRFVVVDDTMPASWRCTRGEDGVKWAGPQPFERPGFFERVFDLVGVFSTEALALAAVARPREQPGFRDHPGGFLVGPVVLDQTYWDGGFVLMAQ